ncbi:MAG: DUF6036 family nucleotidyltransferase [Spirochaetota bacterium]
MKVSKDFKEFIELLNKNNVNYLLVGGYAVGYHSRPRYTEDIDIWIQPSLENAKKIIHVLNKFGFTGVSVSIEELIQPEKIIQLGLPPQRIDILTSIDGVNFNEAWERRIVDSFGDIPVFIISLKDLIKNKSSSGRTKDLQDIEWIKMYGKEA